MNMSMVAKRGVPNVWDFNNFKPGTQVMATSLNLHLGRYTDVYVVKPVQEEATVELARHYWPSQTQGFFFLCSSFFLGPLLARSLLVIATEIPVADFTLHYVLSPNSSALYMMLHAAVD
ncbi:uncharacterized protein B0J16DRAFT_315739 [Fusarium flagelliforme]|uniref:uncharacterized protein n=1 Tax=Fusarium flagelliforme TaxID=2675880 RepID=UPI001E8D942D|nr:uncharacterized protein B0J16DRAFT_315739 [Fusarium flagelliforme]KAH7192045.1 hypothetical protein B0J16DRAFT_315739 [Fusarium flagelliforme]